MFLYQEQQLNDMDDEFRACPTLSDLSEPVYRGCGSIAERSFEGLSSFYEDELALGELQPVPPYYNSLSSFNTNFAHEHVFRKLQSLLRSKETESFSFRAFPGTNQIQGVFDDIRFEIALFQESTGEILIEFSRHSGCPFQFSALQAEIRAELSTQKPRHGIRAPPALCLDSSDTMECDEEGKFSQSFALSLLNMAQSDYQQEQREGITHLASLSTHMLHDHRDQIVTVAIRLLSSADLLTQRAAAKLLCNAFENNLIEDNMICDLEHHVMEWMQEQPENLSVFSELIRCQTEKILRTANILRSPICVYS